MSQVLFKLSQLEKSFSSAGADICILDKVDLEIYQGESVAIVGSSGSGKSTLLHILGTLDTPSNGLVSFEGRNLELMSNAEKAKFRNHELGFVFQFHCLMPEFNTRENVAMPAIIGGVPRKKALKMADEMLFLVGLEHRLKHRVTTLSGGERQRAAIARAILNKPKVLLADEPTGNLDEKNGAQAINLLLRLNKELGMTMVVVTHNRELAARMDRCLEMRQGTLHDQTM